MSATAIAGSLSATLAAVVLLLPPTGTDLAAQVARADFWSASGAATYDLRWYAGVHPAAYSVLAPPVLAAVGVGLAGALAAIAGSVALASLLARAEVARPRWGAGWGAVALTANVLSGRITFALGSAVGLLALLALPRRPPAPAGRAWAAGLLSGVSALFSPVAALFVGLAGLALAGTGRRREGGALVVGAAVPLLLIRWAFPDGGTMPFAWRVAWPPMLAALGVAALLPRAARVVRLGAVLYAAGVATAFVLPNPLGSNAERLALLLAGPVLVAMARRPAVLLVPVLALTAYWQAQPGLADLRHSGDPAARPGYSAGLLAELHRRHAESGRVEVVPQRNHWESVRIAGDFPLARGWERQVDLARNPLFYRGRLTPAVYRAWLSDRAVGFVALADVPLDWAGGAEADLVRSGQPWLQLVWSDAHWRLWQVRDAAPLVAPPARVLAAGADWVTVAAPAAGSVTVRLRWSRWLSVRGPSACLRRDGDWVRLEARVAGDYRISSSTRPAAGRNCG